MSLNTSSSSSSVASASIKPRANTNNNNSGRRNNNRAAGNNRNGSKRGGGDDADRNATDTLPIVAETALKAAIAAREAAEEENGDNNCVVCFKAVEIFSIGECDHAVCYECSTRMRVLCKQNECPICRTDMSKVIFTTDEMSFRQLEINNRTGLYDKKHRICFASLRCQEAYNKLLESPCTICNQNFANFALLREHVKKKHEKHYCDICTANLSIFSFERRAYSRVDLGIHRRKGDVDDTSHRGHPICEYCDVRFFDRDLLYKHLRREHYYCHFCDADGANCYYADYAALRVHFKAEHFLCEDGECAEEQFTAVFRTEIDLRAHINSVHSSGLSRQAARQNRMLEFEITLAPRAGSGAASGQNRGHRDTQNEFDMPSSGNNHHYNHHQQQQQHQLQQQNVQQVPQRVIDARNENEFPSLGGGPSSGVGAFTLQPLVRAYGGTRGIARTLDNFPTLGGGGAPAVSSNVTPASSSAYKKTASALLKGNNATVSASSSSSTGASNSGMVIHLTNRPSAPANRSQDFPSLGGSSSGGGGGGNSAAGKGKKPSSATLFQDDDYTPLATSMASQYGGSLSAKHRTLASNGYESALTGGTDAKLGVVKRAVELAKKTHESVPKMNSNHSFPTLGNAPSAAMSAQWVTLGGGSKKAPVESRKSKVAPPPLSTQTSVAPATASKSRATTAATVTASTASTAKKPTNAPAKPSTPVKQSSASAASSRPAVAAAASKPKQKNYNPFETDSDEEQDKFVPASAVMSALSSKHRNLVDSYESVAKTGGNKLSMVQQVDRPVGSSPSKAAPRLSSENNFPSLGGAGVPSGTSSFSGVNFMNIVKASNAGTGKKSPSGDNDGNNNNSAMVSRAPPGFAAASAQPPPPGFKSVSVTSRAKNANEMTFTTSAGEAYSVPPGGVQQYRAPPNSARRNQALFAHVQTIAESIVVNSFKQVSQMFISDAYKAEPYYEHCRAALAGRFDELFPELVALLPDIGKQQELYLVYTQQLQLQAKASGAKPKKRSGASGTNALEVCATCKQVLVAADLIGHVQSHALENNFPTLSLRGNNGANAATASAWKK